MKLIDIETQDGDVVVEKHPDGTYDVIRGGVVRHPGCTAEDVMRALAFYLHGAEYRIGKLLESGAK